MREFLRRLPNQEQVRATQRRLGGRVVRMDIPPAERVLEDQSFPISSSTLDPNLVQLDTTADSVTEIGPIEQTGEEKTAA